MSHRFPHALLRPFVRTLLFRLNAQVHEVPQPTDAPHAHASGADPDRILLFGSGPAVGYGVLSHELALPGHLARQLSEVTGRGVDVDVVASSDVTAATSIDLLEPVDLWRYDAVVITVGLNDALLLTSPAAWRSALMNLLQYIASRTSARTGVLVIGIPPMRALHPGSSFSSRRADGHAEALNRETRRVVQSRPRVSFVPFSPLAARSGVEYRSSSTYGHWASIIVPPLHHELRTEHRGERERRPGDESARLSALAATGILDTQQEERFDRITQLATQLLMVDIAILAFVDDERHWAKSSTNMPVQQLPRVGTFGSATIEHGGLFIVPDARIDDRFSANTHVVGEPRVVFYAGYPIHSTFGEPIGVLSVYDTAIRQWGDDDTEILRELAVMAQRELESDDP